MTNFSTKEIARNILGSTKRKLYDQGFHSSTKRGNAELKYLIKRLSSYPFRDLSHAQQTGERLGDAIINYSNNRGKQHLDSGTIRMIAMEKTLFEQLGLDSLPVNESSHPKTPRTAVRVDLSSKTSENADITASQQELDREAVALAKSEFNEPRQETEPVEPQTSFEEPLEPQPHFAQEENISFSSETEANSVIEEEEAVEVRHVLADHMEISFVPEQNSTEPELNNSEEAVPAGSEDIN